MPTLDEHIAKAHRSPGPPLRIVETVDPRRYTAAEARALARGYVIDAVTMTFVACLAVFGIALTVLP